MVATGAASAVKAVSSEAPGIQKACVHGPAVHCSYVLKAYLDAEGPGDVHKA